MPDLSTENVQVLKDQVFGGQSSTQSQPSQTDTTNTDTTNSNSTTTTTDATAVDTTSTQTTANTDTTTQTNNDQDIFDEAVYVKNTFGFDTVEAAKNWITQQREIEKNPPKYEPTWANDEAKRWAEYFTAGKEDELWQNLNSRRQVRNIDTLNDDQKIKLFIQMQNPLFDQEMVDYQFKRDYGFNEDQFKDEDGNITDQMGYRFAKVSAQQKLQNDLARAGEYFTQYKSKIDLAPLQQAPTVDQDYENYKEFRTQQEQSQRNLEETLSKITEDKVNYTYKFNDEASKLTFDINFSADKQGFENARKAAVNYFEYLNQNYYTQDGQPMNEKFLRDIYIAQNLDKFAAEIAKQAVNADRKWFLANQKNITDTGQRNYNTVVPDDLQRLKEQVFGKTG